MRNSIPFVLLFIIMFGIGACKTVKSQETKEVFYQIELKDNLNAKYIADYFPMLEKVRPISKSKNEWIASYRTSAEKEADKVLLSLKSDKNVISVKKVESDITSSTVTSGTIQKARPTEKK